MKFAQSFLYPSEYVMECNFIRTFVTKLKSSGVKRSLNDYAI
jgi:hypothetical protein